MNKNKLPILFIMILCFISLGWSSNLSSQSSVRVRASARASASASTSSRGGGNFFFYSPGWVSGYSLHYPSWGPLGYYGSYGEFYDRNTIRRHPRRKGHHYWRLPKAEYNVESNRLKHEYIGP